MRKLRKRFRTWSAEPSVKESIYEKSLIALAFGTLALGMAEFVMMGILPDVARDLGVSIPRAGDLISAYAIGVCVGLPRRCSLHVSGR